MADTSESSTQLRHRVFHHRRLRADAEGARAVMLADRADALITLADDEMREFDDEVARLARAIERADAHLALLLPALATADRVEIEADERAKAAAAAEQDRGTVSGAAALFGAGEAAIAAVTLRAAAVPERPINPRMFDPPMPTVRRDDQAWWDAREKREREERAARLAAATGQPAADLSVYNR